MYIYCNTCFLNTKFQISTSIVKELENSGRGAEWGVIYWLHSIYNIYIHIYTVYNAYIYIQYIIPKLFTSNLTFLVQLLKILEINLGGCSDVEGWNLISEISFDI